MKQAHGIKKILHTLGFDPNSKIDWTSAGAPSGALPDSLYATRPTVMSLYAEHYSKILEKAKLLVIMSANRLLHFAQIALERNREAVHDFGV